MIKLIKMLQENQKHTELSADLCVYVSVKAVLAPFFLLSFRVVAPDVVAAAARPCSHAHDVVVPVGHPK